MAGQGHPLVAAYLRQLDDAARVLPGPQRAELVTDIRQHLADALPPDADEATVRSALDRLGDPGAIVAAALGPGSESDRRVVSVTPGRRTSAWLELSAALLMTLGSLIIPVIGWVIGVALMWTSRRWRVREKVLGTLLVPGGLGGIALLALLPARVESCFTSTSAPVDGSQPPVTVSDCSADSSSLTDHLIMAGLVTAAVLALVVPFVLFVIARRRADAETHVVFAPAPA